MTVLPDERVLPPPDPLQHIWTVPQSSYTCSIHSLWIRSGDELQHCSSRDHLAAEQDKRHRRRTVDARGHRRGSHSPLKVTLTHAGPASTCRSSRWVRSGPRAGAARGLRRGRPACSCGKQPDRVVPPPRLVVDEKAGCRRTKSAYAVQLRTRHQHHDHEPVRCRHPPPEPAVAISLRGAYRVAGQRIAATIPHGGEEDVEVRDGEVFAGAVHGLRTRVDHDLTIGAGYDNPDQGRAGRGGSWTTRCTVGAAVDGGDQPASTAASFIATRTCSPRRSPTSPTRRPRPAEPRPAATRCSPTSPTPPSATPASPVRSPSWRTRCPATSAIRSGARPASAPQTPSPSSTPASPTSNSTFSISNEISTTATKNSTPREPRTAPYSPKRTGTGPEQHSSGNCCRGGNEYCARLGVVMTPISRRR